MLLHQYFYEAAWKLALVLFQTTTPLNESVGDAGESFALKDIIGRMGWPARAVAIVLVLMSIYSMSVMLERWLTFNAARNQSRKFAPQVANALRDRQIAEA